LAGYPGLTKQEIADAVGLNPTDKALRVSGILADLPNNQKPVRRKKNAWPAAQVFLSPHRIFDMWLACYTEQEIAKVVGLNPAAIISNNSQLFDIRL